MATLILPYPAFTAGTPAVAAEVQDNFTTIRDHINGQNIGTANLENTLVSRVGGPILFLNQASQEQIALSILNSRTKSALQITQSAVLGAGSSIIHIDDNATQTTGSANLLLDLQPLSTIPAILVKHGAVETMSLTKDQLDLYASSLQLSGTAISLFSSAVEFSNSRIKLPIRTTTERNIVTQEGSVLYDTSKKEFAFRTDTTWISASTPTGCIQMFAGSFAPQGWLYCNGAIVSQATYPDLFAVVGATYNTGGEGVGNFRLPNFVGIFPRGSEMGGTTTQTISGITYTGGSLNTKQADQMQSHKHNTVDRGSALDGPGSSYNGGDFMPRSQDLGVPITDGVNGTPRLGSETRPANIAIAYIIKT